MKFLCDRCKTRYSIGDDRVRGKILKIRCKNCANVITVREGMPDADAVAANDPARPAKRTTMAPEATTTKPAAPAAAGTNGSHANGSALGAAFASAMTKPPPALEEEWYVSIDGDQAGPYTLAEAQRWVAGKPFDADLHCWSEGFDDWLPVDKVSHFRGLRKKPAPPPAPPPPRAAPRPPGLVARDAMMTRPASGQPAHAPIDESEPKPLFAATMASLEKSAGASSSAGINLPIAAATAATPAAPTVPAVPLAPMAIPPKPTAIGVGLGAGAGAAAPAGGLAPSARIGGTPSLGQAAMQAPMQAKTVNGLAPPALPSLRSPVAPAPVPAPAPVVPPRPITDRGVGAKPGRTTLGFDASEVGEQATTIEPARAFDGPGTSGNDVFAKALAAAAPAPAPAPAKPPNFGITDSLASLDAEAAATAPNLHIESKKVPNSGWQEPAKPDPEDGDIDIGEVSRVVKLADIARVPRTPKDQTGAIRKSGPIGTTTQSVNALNRTGAVPRMATAAIPRVNATGAVARLSASDLAAGAATTPEAALEPAVHPVNVQRKRGMVLLIAAALMLISVAVVVVVFVVMNEDEPPPASKTGTVTTIDDTRPPDWKITVETMKPPTPGSGSGSAAVAMVGSDNAKGSQTAIKPPTQGSGQKITRDVRDTQKGSQELPQPASGPKLEGSEIEAKATGSNSLTSQCFVRSSRGSEGILVMDVKKVIVDFSVRPDGTVESVRLGGLDPGLVRLNSCLTTVVRSWKFRASPGGGFRITMVPPS